MANDDDQRSMQHVVEQDIRQALKSQAEAHAREREADRKEIAEVKKLLHEQTLATSQALKDAEDNARAARELARVRELAEMLSVAIGRLGGTAGEKVLDEELRVLLGVGLNHA